MACPSEALLQAFVDGELAVANIATLAAHLDGCAACRSILGAAQPVRDGEGDVDHVGRYVLRRTLGQGGMGVVYEAFDPELDRVVALKLLRSELGSPRLQSRLVTEARAMAKLSHPNVVSVYDIGRSDEQVFLVMDLVVGSSLRVWMSAAQRSLREVLDVFTRAGTGLAAAHSAGLLHRDFKPENVLIASDGRVLVGDFGLALSADEALDGAVIAGEGSPAYMAPEQRAGIGFDERSDQYSYCLALREALTDAAGSVGPSPLRVPRWLWRIVERGIAHDPAQRYSTMTELLAALARGRRGQRLRPIALGVLVAAVGLGGVAFWAGIQRQRATQQCRNGAAQVDALWSPAIADRVGNAFVRTASPLADQSWQRARVALDAYGLAWRDAHQRICEATRLHGEQSEALLDRKMNCLAERRQVLGGVVALLEHVDGAVLERVPSVLQLLQPVATCEEMGADTLAPPPPDAQHALVVEEARGIVAQAAAAISAGRYEDGLALASRGRAVARASHYLPVQAEASLWVGTAQGRLGHPQEAERALEEAASSGSASHASAVAVRAWIQLMHFVGFELHHYDDGQRYNDYAEAALRTMTHVPELEAERMSWQSALLVDRGHLVEALEISKRQLALVETQLGVDHRLYAAALDGIAGILAAQGKARDAIPIQTRACEALTRVLAEAHPQRALCLNNLAGVHATLGEHEVAIELKRSALAMLGLLPGHPSHAAMTHRNLARSLMELDRLPEASHELAAAAALGKTSSDEIALLGLLGQLHRREGRLADALAEHTRAVTRRESAEPAQRLDPLLDLAETQLAAKHAREAAQTTEEAVRIAESLYGPISFRLAEPLRLRAEALLSVGHRDDARTIAARALASVRDAQVDPKRIARAEALLTRANRTL